MDERPRVGNPQTWGCSPDPRTVPPSQVFEAQTGREMSGTRVGEGQRVAPPSEQQVADKKDQGAEGQTGLIKHQGPGLQGDPS